jgi:hypothetical protein
VVVGFMALLMDVWIKMELLQQLAYATSVEKSIVSRQIMQD